MFKCYKRGEMELCGASGDSNVRDGVSRSTQWTLVHSGYVSGADLLSRFPGLHGEVRCQGRRETDPILGFTLEEPSFL